MLLGFIKYSDVLDLHCFSFQIKYCYLHSAVLYLVEEQNDLGKSKLL